MGEIPNATFDSDIVNKSAINQSIRGYADKLTILGSNKTSLEGAEITTCEVGQTDWFIKGSQIDIDNKTKSVDATNARMEFKDCQFFILLKSTSHSTIKENLDF